MKEIFLYGCEDCGLCLFKKIDCGKVYYGYCAGCKQGSFYEKVVIKPAYDMFGVFQGNKFVVEEKKDENSNTGTNQKT